VPYWDWAADSDVPPSVGTPEIEVTMPNGPARIRNPLYSFVFPKEVVDGKYGSITGSRDKTATKRCSPAEANEGMARVDLKGMVVSSPQSPTSSPISSQANHLWPFHGKLV
jgi:tyrosinase